MVVTAAGVGGQALPESPERPVIPGGSAASGRRGVRGSSREARRGVNVGSVKSPVVNGRNERAVVDVLMMLQQGDRSPMNAEDRKVRASALSEEATRVAPRTGPEIPTPAPRQSQTGIGMYRRRAQRQMEIPRGPRVPPTGAAIAIIEAVRGGELPKVVVALVTTVVVVDQRGGDSPLALASPCGALGSPDSCLGWPKGFAASSKLFIQLDKNLS